MRFAFVAAFALIALVSYVHCGCDDDARSPDDSEISVFFKNLGCDFKKISDSAKPWVEKIENSAKQLTDTVADKFSDLKSKISGSSDTDASTENSTATTTTSTSALLDVISPSSATSELPATVASTAPPADLPTATPSPL